jgi:hypothetical protein
MKFFIKYFDIAEDHVRFSLSRRPIIYAFISGIGTVLFFRGVWMIADEMPFLTGTVTLAVSLTILLLTGAFVFHFLGRDVIVSGVRREKKLEDKSAAEIIDESDRLAEIQRELQKINRRLESIDKRD